MRTKDIVNIAVCDDEEAEVREAILAYDDATIGTEKLEVFKERQSFWIRQRDIRYIAAYNGYIVNFFWVTGLEEKEIIVGKIRFPLFRRQRKDIKDAYMQFDVKYR